MTYAWLRGRRQGRKEIVCGAPDALHAAACRRADFLLVTMDKRLAAAEELGVRAKLLSPG